MNRHLRECFRRANHTQRVMRLGDGDWLWFRESGPVRKGKMILHTGKPEAETCSEFSMSVLAGSKGELASSGAQSSVARLSEKSLALAWVTENRVMRCRGEMAQGSLSWSAVESVPAPVGDELLLGNVRVLGDGQQALPWSVQGTGGRSVTGVTLGKPGHWKVCVLAKGRGAFAPFLLDDGGGCFHVVWAQADERVYYTRGTWDALPEEASSDPVLAALDGRQPLLMVDGEDVLLVYESHYSYPQSMMIRSGHCPAPGRVVCSAVLKDDPRFVHSICHTLQLVRDAHGVPTLFFAENIRQQLFYTRWLGEGWGPVLSLPAIVCHTARPDRNYSAIGIIAAEGDRMSGTEEIGLFVEPENEADSPQFVRYRAISFDGTKENMVRFIDLRELARMSGMEQHVFQGEKLKSNPLIARGEAGAFNAGRAVNWGSFLQTDKGWEAWFRGIAVSEKEIGFEWWKALITGYARSPDGLRWEFPSLNRVGRGDGYKNVIPDLPGQYVVYFDPEDADPQRRYKIVYFLIAGEKEIAAQAEEYDCLKERIPGWLLTSPNGLNWNRQPISLSCPGSSWFEHCPMCLLHDPEDPDPQRRWKTYGYASLTLGRRACSLATSPDLVHWTLQEEPALPAERHGHPWVPAGAESQVHGMVVQRLGQYYVGLVQYQCDKSRCWIELAVSRDGLRFDPIGVGQPLVERGGRDAWDEGMLMPMNLWRGPDHWRIYYNGFNMPVPGRGVEASVGIATFPVDGLVGLQLREGVNKGRIMTTPVKLCAGARYALSVRASGAEVQAHILGDDGEVVETSDWLRGDGKVARMTWRGRSSFTNQDSSPRIMLTIQGKGNTLPARVFSVKCDEMTAKDSHE